MLAEYSDSLVQLAGIVGVSLYVAAYGLLQTGFLRGSGYSYAVLNLIGASFVLISLQEAFNLASAIIQTAWILISILGIIRITWLRRRIRFSEEEHELLNEAFEGLPAPLARRLLDRGIWAEWEPGCELTQEGEDVTHLYYLSGGAATVVSAGRPIAEVRRGLIGEMNVMRPGPASATVRVAETARIFSISGDVLRSLARKDAELRMLLEQFMAQSTRQKLMTANARLANRESADAETARESARGAGTK